jgi:dipeptidyl aminopeptidase/acylaminoacyl peptidase
MTVAKPRRRDAHVRLTFEAHQSLRRPSEAVVSPDGHRIAWSLPAAACLDPEVGAQARIWVVDRDGDPEELTDGPGVDTLPRWSPGSGALAYASDRGHPGRLSLHLLRLGTDERSELGEIAGSVEEITWSSDGSRLLVLAADVGSDRAGSFQATRILEKDAPADDPRVFRPRHFFRRLLVVDLEGHTTEVGPPGLTVWEADWNGGPLVAAIVSSDPSESGWFDASLVVWNVDAGEVVSRYESEWQLAVARLAPDSTHVAFVEALSSDRGDVAGAVRCARIDGPSLEARTLGAPLDVSWLRWVKGDRLLYAGWRGLHTACGLASLSGEIDEVWSGPATIGSRLCARAEADAGITRLAAVIEASNVPPEVAVLDVNGSRSWEAVTAFNGHLTAGELPRWQEYSWQAPDGLAIDGLLVLPPAVAASQLPLVVIVHGGPTTSWSHAWISDIPRLPLLWASEGYAVLLPNPRGSRGYGQAFARANLGDLGGRDLDDIVAGIDVLAAAGIVDETRVGITGNSYGGFIAGLAVGKTDRFAAAIPMAVISNWLSFHNTSNSGRFDELFLEADPYAPGGAYHERSPVVHARHVTAPTLIMQGELDLCTPVGQAQELYQAIAECGEAEVELVVFPREGHAYLERGHQTEIWERSLAWFGRHLAARAEVTD